MRDMMNLTFRSDALVVPTTIGGERGPVLATCGDPGPSSAQSSLEVEETSARTTAARFKTRPQGSRRPYD